VIAGPRNHQLEHRERAVVQCRLGHERLGRGLVRAADRDRPVVFEVGDDVG
jgi:hypothetical protein